MQTYYIETTTPKRKLQVQAKDIQNLADYLATQGIKHITKITTN